MRRTILFLMLGVLGAAVLVSAISVYLFHDVDRDQIGRWSEAFVGLCIESVLFTLIIGGSVAILTLLGRYAFHLKGHFPRAWLGLSLGIGVTVFQYPWDFALRKQLPKLAETSLYLYPVGAIVVCAAVILCDNFKQMKSHQGHAVPFDN